LESLICPPKTLTILASTSRPFSRSETPEEAVRIGGFSLAFALLATHQNAAAFLGQKLHKQQTKMRTL
jgi:hypothetical protein